MDQNLLRAYFSTVYELPADSGVTRASIDGEVVKDPSTLPALLQKEFAIITAYNPRSMLLPRRVNEARHQVMRDLLVMGSFRVEHCVAFEEEPEGVWREPSWVVYNISRDEAISVGRTFRQNGVIFASGGRPELIITDPTCDDIGRTFSGHWRVRS